MNWQQRADFSQCNFPKQHTRLPPEYQDIYRDTYISNRYTTSFFGMLKHILFEAWMHKSVSKYQKGNLLEIGPGLLNHIPYINPRAVSSYSVLEPTPFLRESWQVSDIQRLRNVFTSIQEAIDSGKKFDTIIAIAVLEHVHDLPSMLVRVKQLLAPGGRIVMSVPSTGLPLWAASWRLSTAIIFWLKYNLRYETIMQYEHVNSLSEVCSAIKQSYIITKELYLGPCRFLSLYSTFIAIPFPAPDP